MNDNVKNTFSENIEDITDASVLTGSDLLLN